MVLGEDTLGAMMGGRVQRGQKDLLGLPFSEVSNPKTVGWNLMEEPPGQVFPAQVRCPGSPPALGVTRVPVVVLLTRGSRIEAFSR